MTDIFSITKKNEISDVFKRSITFEKKIKKSLIFNVFFIEYVCNGIVVSRV